MMKNTTSHKLVAKIGSVIVIFFLVFPVDAQSQADCGSLVRQIGPYDYTDPRNRTQLAIVEKHHLSPKIYRLERDLGALPGDHLAYILDQFPNHHIALHLMSSLAMKQNKEKPTKARYTIDCYFDRAVRFRVRDGIVRMLYGNYQFKRGRLDEALASYAVAEEVEPNNSEVLYNFGLLHFRLKHYDEAARYAKRAYALGYPKPGLMELLKKEGAWQADG